MSNIDSSHLLKDVISSAEDILVLVQNYNMVNADDVLRNSVEYDNRPVIIIGTEKRHSMCKKKLPQIFSKLGIDYDNTSVTYVTQEGLKDFASSALEQIASGEVVPPEPSVKPKPKPPKPPISIRRGTEPIRESVEESPTAEETQEEVIHQEDAEDEEQQSTQEVVIEHSPHEDVGVCKYGVPKLKVQYITPNVLGLQESITVKVEEEDIEKFFVSIKNRVLKSISNDR